MKKNITFIFITLFLMSFFYLKSNMIENEPVLDKWVNETNEGKPLPEIVQNQSQEDLKIIQLVNSYYEDYDDVDFSESIVHEEIKVLDECTGNDLSVVILSNNEFYSGIAIYASDSNQTTVETIEPSGYSYIDNPVNLEHGFGISLIEAKNIVQSNNLYEYEYQDIVYPCINGINVDYFTDPYYLFEKSSNVIYVGYFDGNIIDKNLVKKRQQEDSFEEFMTELEDYDSLDSEDDVNLLLSKFKENPIEKRNIYITRLEELSLDNHEAFSGLIEISKTTMLNEEEIERIIFSLSKKPNEFVNNLKSLESQKFTFSNFIELSTIAHDLSDLDSKMVFEFVVSRKEYGELSVEQQQQVVDFFPQEKNIELDI